MIHWHKYRTPFRELTVLLLLLLLAAAWPTTALAQTPHVLWAKSLGARLFAVDSQTNVYANAGGSVITLNGVGLPLATNSICPLPGLAQRDAQGNFYFPGRFTAPQGFRGGVLAGGHCFLAKYTFSGTLIWAVSFGP